MGNDVHTRRICELPVLLANQIAAGEVVERPASVAKELLENSLDADARGIEVQIEQGGVRLIRVRDDGSGIHRADLGVALRRHATSKIRSLADLEEVASLGFRGEALPSIASVSRLTLISRCAADECGWRVTADGEGSAAAAVPVGHPIGTTVEVRDLFYSTPARRKFLRSERTEQRHLQQIVKRTALGRFDVGFRLQCDGASTLHLPPAVTDRARAQRLAKICGAAFVQHALHIQFETAGLRVSGWVGGIGFSRATPELQHLFVNGRWVRDSTATHALRQAYQAWLGPDRYGAYVLYIDIDPRAVDVNVHPTKHEIRFRDRRLVHDFLLSSVASALAESGVEPPGPMPPAPRRSLQGASWGSALDRGWSTAQDGARADEASPSAARDSGAFGLAPGPSRTPSLGRAVGKLDCAPYLLAENAAGLVLVDVRAALRMVLYRQLMLGFEAGGVQARPLLLPKSLPVDPEQLGALEAAGGLLRRMGLELRCSGPATLSVRRIPTLLQGASVVELVGDLLSSLGAGHDARGGGLRAEAILQAMARHAAAAAEPPGTLPEMNALLRDIETAEMDASRNSCGCCWVQVSMDRMRQLFRQERASGQAC